jgi:hypothetical protein
MSDTSFDTIDICSLETVSGGTRKKAPRKTPKMEVEAPEAYGQRPFPGGGSQAIDGLGQQRLNSFCAREPFACANMRSGGNI